MGSESLDQRALCYARKDHRDLPIEPPEFDVMIICQFAARSLGARRLRSKDGSRS